MQTINMALHEKVALTSFYFHFLGGVNLRVCETCLDRKCSWDATGVRVS